MTLPKRLKSGALALASTVLVLSGSVAAAPVAGSRPAPAGCTGPASATWLNVTVEGVRSSRGLVAVTLYADDSRKFLAKKGSLYVGRVPAVSGTTRACIFVPGPGVWAIATYHDENSSRGFDRTGLGLPAEGYGFSNNPSTIAGLPSFRSVRLNVARSGLNTRVRMKYP